MISGAALAVALTASPVHPRFCQDELQPVGSSIGVLSADDNKRDLDVVVRIAKVLRRDEPLRTLGYIVAIKNGYLYYETRPAPLLTPQERAIESKLLLTPGLVTPRNGKPVDLNGLRQTVESPLSAYVPIGYDPMAFTRNELRVVHCTPRASA